jgi:predicted metal-dependent hydrolase
MLRALFLRRPPAAQQIEITFEESKFVVRVKRHRQARRYTLRVQAATREVVLTMPQRGSIKDAKAFAEKNNAWIAVRLNRLPDVAPFSDGGTVPLRGVAHRIVHRPRTRGTVWVETAGNEKLLCVAGDPPHVARRITDFLKREARRELEQAAKAYARTLGVSIKRLTVRDQSSRWGSCSSTGALSFSWRLILAPPFVLDYLAAHEVIHLIEMNHSPRFWRMLHELCPDMKRAKTWLDIHGSDLHRYGSQGSSDGPVTTQ